MNYYDANPQARTRWASFENPDADKAAGAAENHGAKGHAFDTLPAGQTVTLMHSPGPGVVRRIWLTLQDRSPKNLRALRIRMYWDDAAQPAVDCPLGDFFGHGLAAMHAFDSELFSSPEGRSLVSMIPMPFYTAALITLTNESDSLCQHLFYDVDFTLEPLTPGQALYFHAWWNRENPTRVARDYTVLPRLAGHGRLLGVSVGVRADEAYKGSWFGEGEVKVWLDGDGPLPTLAGTGTEDYAGTAWGMGVYATRLQGCLEADAQTGRYSYYRWHTADPIWFSQDIRVGLQAIGGDSLEQVRRMQAQGARLRVVSGDAEGCFTGLYDPDREADLTGLAEGWYNFYREDDYASTAYFYLDRPESGLPALPDTEFRTRDMG